VGCECLRETTIELYTTMNPTAVSPVGKKKTTDPAAGCVIAGKTGGVLPEEGAVTPQQK